MKRIAALLLVLCLLLAGCAASQTEVEIVDEPVVEEITDEAEVIVEEEPAEQVEEETKEAPMGKTIMPLPDTTMDDLTDAILHVSFEKENVYVDDEGILQMDVKIYSHDMYDMVDVAMLEVGDVIVGYAGEVEVTALERNENGVVLVNGGLGEGGFDLVTEDEGVFFEVSYNDMRNWYEVGTATLRVSANMEGTDNADPELGEVAFYPGDLVTDAIENFHFTPHNTTVRVEGGQIVEMNRRYTP